MLNTWGGNNGIDTVSQDELDSVGFDICAKYCKDYCWHYGIGYCNNCAYDKERTKRRDTRKFEELKSIMKVFTREEYAQLKILEKIKEEMIQERDSVDLSCADSFNWNIRLIDKHIAELGKKNK